MPSVCAHSSSYLRRLRPSRDVHPGRTRVGALARTRSIFKAVANESTRAAEAESPLPASALAQFGRQFTEIDRAMR